MHTHTKLTSRWVAGLAMQSMRINVVKDVYTLRDICICAGSYLIQPA